MPTCLFTRSLPIARAQPGRHRKVVAKATAAPADRAYSNLIGVHALVWTGGWSHEDARLAIEGTRDAGFDLIEVPLLDPSTIDVAFTRSCLEDHDVLASASLGLAPHTDVNSEDAECQRRGRELLAQALDVAAGIGVKDLCGVLYSALQKYPGSTTPAARQSSVSAIRELADRAADKGVRLSLETVNRYETNLMNTALEAMEFIDEVNRPNVFVHLDSYHMNIEENSMAAAVATCGDKLQYVHVGEAHRGYLGTGTCDLPGLFRALEVAEYKGTITFESFSSAVVSAELSNTLGVWRNLWDDGAHLARHARSYIDAQMTAAKMGGRNGPTR